VSEGARHSQKARRTILISAGKPAAARHDGALQIRNPRPNVRRVLDFGDLTPHIV
jgi:hypothetical protein